MCISIEKFNSENKNQAVNMLKTYWEAEFLVSKGKKQFFKDKDGFIALIDNNIKGIITFEIIDKRCEVVSLNSFKEKMGIASKLLDKVSEYARKQNCDNVWLLATNDNCKALRFYQMYGFDMYKFYRLSMNEVRKHKPTPVLGIDNIPSLHEIEFIKEL